MTSKIYIIMILCATIVAAQSDLKVISSDVNSIVLEFSPVSLTVKSIDQNNSVYKKIKFKGSITPSSVKAGSPEIPFKIFDLGVPSEFGNTVSVISAEYKDVNGKIIPVPYYNKGASGVSIEYNESESYNEKSVHEIVSFGEYGIVRDLPVQTFIINPVEYFPKENRIRLYTRIKFRINYAPASGSYSRVSERILENTILNFETARNWGFIPPIRKTPVLDDISSGTWYRFETPEEGIYKITRQMLSSMGIDAASVDPRTIRIFNNGGKNIAEDQTAIPDYGLNEIAIKVVGEEDGVFNEQDYILFYGRGTVFFEQMKGTQKVQRFKHTYSAKNYYWITSGNISGKRMSSLENIISGQVNENYTTKAYISYEDDRINLHKSGRLYVGEEFNESTRSRTFISSVTNRVPSSTINYKFQFVNDSRTNVTLSMDENNNRVTTMTAYGATASHAIGRLISGQGTYTGFLDGERSVLKFTFNTSIPNVKGYLDYFEIEYSSYLKSVNDQVINFSSGNPAINRYSLSGFSNSLVEVFDVTDHNNVKPITNPVINLGEVSFTVHEADETIRKYLTVCTSKFLTPRNIEQVNNSSLLTDLDGADFIIITNRVFSAEAERLKNYRQNDSPNRISTRIVYVDEIINEFGGGLVDPSAIRNFLRYVFENWVPKPFYVLFFGDGDYDFLNKEAYGKNFVMTYQTEESLHDVDAYPTDDFFTRISGNDKKIDFAHGRVPVNSTADANSFIDKIIQYEKNSEKGLWRNTVTLVADDGLTSEGDDGVLHTDQSEDLSKNVLPKYFDQKKIYLATYPTVNTGTGRRKPLVNRAIVDAVNNGTLLLNFIGHGNPDTWTHEYVFERASTIPQFTNKDFFFLNAATCDFGRFDDPASTSSTEEMLFLENKGMIGGFSSTRAVYSNQNAALNESFLNNLFNVKDTANVRLRVGDAIWRSKQIGVGLLENSEKFHIFTDPTLRINEPDLPVSVDSINGNAATVSVQIKALGKVSLSGTAQNLPDGSSFNGEGIVTVFDSEREVKLKDLRNYTIILPGGVLFRGRVSVTNGKFGAAFTVPKDISYENKNGKIVAYIFNEDYDGVGYSSNIIVGGTDSTVVNDGNGPEIDIFFDDESYSNSYLVNGDFTLIAKLSDETGLNTTGTGIGHKLEGILNGDDANTIDFTNYFIGDVNSGGKSGVIKYQFSSFTEGDYEIKLKAWDVFNNYSDKETGFIVVNGDGIHLRDVVNYPNPFSNVTYFTFQHNYPQSINVKIKIYTIAGRLIKEIESGSVSERFVKIFWDGRDQDGNPAANGTYLYKLSVESYDNQLKQTFLGKLAIVR
ncbi:MAG: type IX secretion system sortase PorU [Ignavibacteriales bacterium]|nr:type IX secretion system sortase PorU [Ignavibacteriales bacterium]MCF8316115.1 type IX secretion system sortase PorU [Ignavibacteriales bacterium]MCF8436617.1 type IX secretion system sortase PorU [Ignavibacteriales bacterium]